MFWNAGDSAGTLFECFVNSERWLSALVCKVSLIRKFRVTTHIRMPIEPFIHIPHDLHHSTQVHINFVAERSIDYIYIRCFLLKFMFSVPQFWC